MDELLSSTLGSVAIRRAIRKECRVIISLPDVQRYFEVRWTGSIHQRKWHDDVQLSIFAGLASPTQSDDSGGTTKLKRQTTSQLRMNISPANVVVEVRRQQAVSVNHSHAQRATAKNSQLVAVAKTLLAYVFLGSPVFKALLLPVVAVWPPLANRPASS